MLDLVDTRQAVVASLASAAAGEEGQGEGEGEGQRERAEREGASLLDVAHAEHLSVGLAKEMLALLELGEPSDSGGGGHAPPTRGGGAIVRDEQAGEGTRWYRNWITGAVWDGQPLE